MTAGLHIDPKGDQGADPALDIEGVTPDAEAIPEVFLFMFFKKVSLQQVVQILIQNQIQVQAWVLQEKIKVLFPHLPIKIKVLRKM